MVGMSTVIGAKQPALMGTSGKILLEGDKHTGERRAEDAIERPPTGRTTLRKVDMDIAAAHRQLQAERKRLPIYPVTVYMVDELVGAVGDGLDVAAHEPLGAGFHLVDGCEDGGFCVTVKELCQAVGAEVERR